MAKVPKAEWDALAMRYGSPFLSWGFLALLEESGSIGPETGWFPYHILVRRGGALVAAAPFYAKTHSWGEFVFDFEFAELAEELGAPYYPKLVGCVPATPAPVWRVLVAPEEDETTLARAVLEMAAEAARDASFGGLHLLWPADPASPGPEFVPWQHASFLWIDEGYGDFDGYLGSFTKNMRRNVRREEAGLSQRGIHTELLAGGEDGRAERLLPRMADFYEATNDKFGPYAARFLNREFFLRLPEFLPKGWLLSAGFEGKDVLGLALLFQGRETLYGRYWGAAERVDGLHFELCYYRPIAYALSRGLVRFDPGMGSEHKARRGFRSILVPSYHQCFDERIAEAYRRFLPAANRREAAYAERLDADLPFRADTLRGGDPR